MNRSIRAALVPVALVVSLFVGAAPAQAGPGKAVPATFETAGSVNQVYVTDAPPGAAATLLRGHRAVDHGTVDPLGGLVFRNVDRGHRYHVDIASNGQLQRSADVVVTSASERPPSSLYSGQKLEVGNLTPTSGYGYLKTRDGTRLSVQVVLPGPPDKGPYPTLMEYSGYDPSNPNTGQPQYKLVAPLLGYAWVGVNIRGTGCSGGSFNYFEELQALDGYDAVETIAAQPWSTGKVGMVGISYAGISQLFVARTRPPHLSAITPLSVIADTYRSTLYPGGIFNDGFALSWATERVNQNRWPNPVGAGWVVQRVNDGDAQCAANLKLRGQNVDLLKKIQDHPYDALDSTYDFPRGGDSLAPAEFARDITTPVFMAGAWQDEQTGGHWPTILPNFRPGVLKRAYGQNGTHTDSLDPTVFLGMTEFLDIYVANRVPSIPAGPRALLPALWQTITGVGNLTVPPDEYTGVTSVAEAKRRFDADGPVHVLWETGNAPVVVTGAPVNTAESTYKAWPAPETRARTYYLDAGGTLRRRLPDSAGRDQFSWDPAARPETDFSGGNIWSADPTYNWTTVPQGKGLQYTTAPFKHDVAMVGSASANLWVQSNQTDTDVQVTLSEVRPDGTERYIQNGWLRASHRKLDRKASSTLRPVQTHLEEDARPLVPGRLTRMRVEIFPFAYDFRAGSRLRLSIAAPGGDRPLWTFATLTPSGAAVDAVGRGGLHASALVLPIVPTPSGLPVQYAPCPSLRGEPCRAAGAVPGGS